MKNNLNHLDVSINYQKEKHLKTMLPGFKDDSSASIASSADEIRTTIDKKNRINKFLCPRFKFIFLNNYFAFFYLKII